MKLPTKSKYPKTLVVKGEEWRIAFVDSIEGKGTLGLCDPSNRIVYIKNGQSKKETYKSFLHEMIHVLELEYDISIPHSSVYKLEEAIYDLLINNF
jgi:hypothetical protein